MNRYLMRLAGATALILLILVPLNGCLTKPTAPQWNIVLITFDTTRADRMGAYGGGLGTSPVFDALAGRGTLFLQAQSQAAVTPVAHASLFTGRNPYNHGLRTLHGNRLYSLPESVPTMAAVLQEAGYETAAFISAFPCGERFGLQQGFATFNSDFGDAPAARVGSAGNVSTGMAQRGAAATTDAALAWLAEQDDRKPFFLWVHYFDPHDPLLRPPAPWQETFMDGFEPFAAMEEELAADPQAFIARYGEEPEVMREWLRRLYDAEIAWADAQMGRLLAEVDQRGLMNRTVLAATADHGEGLGDHDWWAHGILYQEQVHVPLAMSGPGIPQGLQVIDRVRLVDVAPTLLQAGAALALPAPVDGLSLWPLMERRHAGLEPRRRDKPGPAYADAVTLMRYGAVFDPQVTEERDDQLYAWIDGDLKWIRHRLRPQESELYDLASDPGETLNLVPARPRDAGRLDRDLENESPMTEELDFSPAEDEEVRRRLRSLGYVD